jgi:predicted nucleic-acid-binding Zn-ribbon protein
MKHTGQCPKCGSADTIEDAAVVHHGARAQHTLMLITLRRPDALIFKSPKRTPVSAWVCPSCGYIELYADQQPTNGTRSF